MSVPILTMASDQRPRERLQALGPRALSDAELVALLLRQGRRGQSAVEMAGELLAEHGGLAGLSSARPEELAARSGVGLAKASALVAAFQLGARVRTTVDSAPLIGSAADAAEAAIPLFADARVERCLVLVCDGRDRLRHKVFVAEGAIDEVPVPVREILNTVLRLDGRAFAVVHNHPSGDPEPSDADERVTRMLSGAAGTVGLRFLDHVVVAGHRWASAMPRMGRHRRACTA